MTARPGSSRVSEGSRGVEHVVAEEAHDETAPPRGDGSMKVAYYKGCLASLSAKELDTSTQALAPKLGHRAGRAGIGHLLRCR